MEGEHAAGARPRVEGAGEVRFQAGALVQKRQRPPPGGQRGGQALRVAPGLDFHPRQRGADRLGLDDARGLAVHVQQVVGEAKARLQRELADGDALRGVDVRMPIVLHRPAGGDEQRVDACAGLLLGCVLGRWCHQRALPVVSAGAVAAPTTEW